MALLWLLWPWLLASGMQGTGGDYVLDLSGELPGALAQIFNSQQDCDLFILVMGQVELHFCAHRLILAANPEAQALWGEPGPNVTMSVDSECAPYMEDLIRYFYSRRIEVSLSSVKCFHKLASAFGATELQAYCGQLFATFLPEDPSFHKALDLYAYARASGDPVLEELCVQFLAWNLENLTQAEVWTSIPQSLLEALLPRSELAVSSELALLQAVDVWSREQGASPGDVEGLVEHIRFPMMAPEDLFELQFTLPLYQRHEVLFQSKILQALEFHTVPLPLLLRHYGLNLTSEAYMPRAYTAANWSASVTNGSWAAHAQWDYPSRAPFVYRKQLGYRYSYLYSPYQSFQTPLHPSFLFRDQLVSWSLVYLGRMQDCWNYGFSCTSDELPALGLTRSGAWDPTVGYDNKALMLCDGDLVVDVADFQGSKAPIPSALDTNSSRRASSFPCASGSFSSYQVVIRPFYFINSTGLE
ncbi:PREDICTED: galectin-3-binding protein isoform X1 [Dipodomys ordii]|uniref:Galectin-3-binding protein isoform X1 n=1 Tax=Dipodomys ordii TaxID=10020 RepID=A0A1S3ELA4_DIPOR|nr:PREDICTED: galectin-3-binding protein isoform X1 [Dipodomys ordii]XP_012864267.1 PREDICTED: galectin-3-binding protein isoform X1 [Dipodomys ordii]